MLGEVLDTRASGVISVEVDTIDFATVANTHLRQVCRQYGDQFVHDDGLWEVNDGRMLWTIVDQAAFVAVMPEGTWWMGQARSQWPRDYHLEILAKAASGIMVGREAVLNRMLRYIVPDTFKVFSPVRQSGPFTLAAVKKSLPKIEGEVYYSFK